MKTITDKQFDAVKYMREQRQKLTEKLLQMTTKEIVDYFKKQRLKNTIKPSA